MIDELIKKYLNENGKINCNIAFMISSKTKIPIHEVGKYLHERNIKIDRCDLGQFGVLKKEEAKDNEEAKQRLFSFKDDKNRVFCKDARNAAKGISLKKIRQTLKANNIDVKYCLLGCFTEKKGKKMKVNTKTWITNQKGELLFGKGKTEVLELIDKHGSISEAAKELGMNYKKAWTHIKILQKNLDDDMVNVQQGGKGTGGTKLTQKAYQMIENYKILQKDIEEFANKRFKELFK